MAPATGPPPSSTPPGVSPDLVAYLDDLPLPAVLFHASAYFSKSPSGLAGPAYQNRACEELLRQGRGAKGGQEAEGQREGKEEERKEVFTECMSEKERDGLRQWLAEEAAAFSSPSSSSSSSSSWAPRPPAHRTSSFSLLPHASIPAPSPPSPSRPKPPPRQLSLKLHDRISWPPIIFNASVREGYTILTQCPPRDVGRGASTPSPVHSPPLTHNGDGISPSSSSPSTASSRRDDAGEKALRGKEQIGELLVDADRVRDPTSLEGVAFTAWHSPIAIFRCNRQLSIVQTNPEWRRICDIPLSESNDAWATRIHPDDLEAVTEHYGYIRTELPEERDEFEFRWLPRADGEEQWCQAVIEPMFVQGELEGYSCSLVNINKHKMLETASELRERQLREELALLSDTCQVGLSRHALDGTFLSVNHAWHAITRVREGERLESFEDNLHPDDRDRVLSGWSRAIKHRQPLSMQFRWKHGEVCLVQVQPNHKDPGKVTGWIGSLTNITAEAHAEEAVLNLSKEREARAKQDAADAEERRKIAVEEKKQQELLIDVTSHEIRNPISAILQNSDFTRSSLQSLRSTFLSLRSSNRLPPELADQKIFNDLEEDIEALDSITECGLAQERIANDILGLAQIQLSKYSITPVEFDMATSLRNICRMFKSECRSKDIELKLVIGSSLARLGPRARVFADPARLTQVLVNLLSNAIRFTAKSATRQVTLSVEVSSKPPDRSAPLVPPEETEYHIDKKRPIYLFFSVEDTGPGMTEEETGRLFAKFMQASPFTHTAWGGSGLGLWIARNLCELQAGRIEVASTVGKGSIFRCFITARSVDAGPTQRSDTEKLPVIEGITGPNAARGAAPKVFLAKPGEDSRPLSGLRVLCCEDNQINRTVLKRQLSKEGAEEVLLACDGQEGLEVLKSREMGEIDCILMDIEMPVMDGLSATRAIRAEEQQGKRLGHQRIVGLTGNARSAQRAAALDAGMDNVVTKPYKIPDLIEKIIGGPDSSTAPPSPNLNPSELENPEKTTVEEDGADGASITLAPTSKEDNEVKVYPSNETSVLSITGDKKLEATEAEGKEAPTVRSSVERFGPGDTLPPSRNKEQVEKESFESKARQGQGVDGEGTGRDEHRNKAEQIYRETKGAQAEEPKETGKKKKGEEGGEEAGQK
ncbi:hypothetical protein JCM11251_000589 [Rhodosporidiobolus azoricus]